MKRILILSLSAVLVLGIAGCQSNQQATLATQAADIQIATESQTEPSADADKNKAKPTAKPTETSSVETTDVAANGDIAVPGTWQSASVAEKDGKSEPEFYVRFTRTEIQYGHMNEGEFVNDRSDKISRIDRNIEGYYLIQAESAKTGKYTFKTSKDDTGIMEYYTTWDENEFADKYVGGSSISKCNL